MRKIFALVMIGIISTSHAVEIEETFGDWAIVRASDGVDLIAVNVNESSSFIGFRCFAKTQQCIHVLSADVGCEVGAEYPILVNSDYSAMSMNAVCGKNQEKFELYLTQYDNIHKILQKGNDIGFAIPMNSGRFKVVRFSLRGSEKAISYVKQKTSALAGGDTYL